jgi:hypothetical protein
MRIQKFRHLFKTVTELCPIVSCHVSCVFLCNTRVNAEFAELELGAGADSGNRISSGFLPVPFSESGPVQTPRIYQCRTVIRIFKEPLVRGFGILGNNRTAGSDYLKRKNQNQVTGSLGYFNNLKRNCDFCEKNQ